MLPANVQAHGIEGRGSIRFQAAKVIHAERRSFLAACARSGDAGYRSTRFRLDPVHAISARRNHSPRIVKIKMVGSKVSGGRPP